jgi:hydrogenase maturation protease
LTNQNESPAAERVAVLCIGNMLMRDDGVGPYIARELAETYMFPDNVEIFDEGCMGMAILPLLDEYDYVLTVDAVDSPDLEPGVVVRFKPEDIGNYSDTIRSAHDMRFIDVLGAAALLGYTVEGYCIGVQAADAFPSEPQIGLTDAVAAAIPLAIQTILATLVGRGIENITIKATGASVIPPGASADIFRADRSV